MNVHGDTEKNVVEGNENTIYKELEILTPYTDKKHTVPLGFTVTNLDNVWIHLHKCGSPTFDSTDADRGKYSTSTGSVRLTNYSWASFDNNHSLTTQRVSFRLKDAENLEITTNINLSVVFYDVWEEK